MLTALYITLVILVIFVYARIMRDHRVYTRLLVCSVVAFLIGSCVKSKTLNTNEEHQTMVVALNPTVHHVDSAVVWTDSIETEVPSQEIKSDTTNHGVLFIKNLSKDVAIEDDS